LKSKETTELDFRPFNADGVLKALCSVLRSSKHLSWNYAGDIQSVIERIGKVFEASRCLIFVTSQGRNDIEVFEYMSSGNGAVAHHFATPLGQKLAEQLIANADELTSFVDVGDVAAELDENYREYFVRTWQSFGTQKTHLIPLRVKSDVAGERRAGLLVLQEPNEVETGWNKIVLDSLLAIADYLAKLAEVEQLVASLEAKETDDTTTGLLNRRTAIALAEKEVARARYCGDTLNLAIFDLDLNKRSPDLYGSADGDAIIKTVAGAIKSNARVIDSAGRWGVDEFIVVMPRVSPEEAFKLADSTRKRINEALMNLGRTLPKLPDLWYPQTVSVGLSSLGRERDSFETLFAASMLSLADAQSSGGNVVKAPKDSDIPVS
jgi:diguanylate cyclase (GGDEF)-like protein